MSKKYTEQEKIEIIDYYKTHTYKETKQKYNIGYSTIKCWINPKFRQKQLNYLKLDHIKNGNKHKRVLYRKKNNKKKYAENKEYYKKQNKLAYQKNKDKIKDYSHNYYKSHKKQLNDFSRKYRVNRYKTDEAFKLKSVLRCRINQALKPQSAHKLNTTYDLVGCSINDLKTHIENQFKEGMTWDNCGQWHIDHIKPCSLFNLTELEEQKKCFHYTNLQPLWAIDNLKKGDKYKPSLCIINCASFKKKHPCPSSQMYDDSKLFRTARDYAQYNFDEYIILSAKYGVLYPNQIIEPYEDTVMFVPNTLLHSGKKYKHLLAPEKREWANNVKKQINPKHYENITFLVGKYYWEFLEPLYKDISNVTKLDLPTGISAAIKFIEKLQETM